MISTPAIDKKALFIANTGFALLNFRLPLMKFLQSQGWSVLGMANDESDFVARFEKENIKFLNLYIDHKGKNPASDLVLINRLRSVFCKESPTLLHNFTIKPVIFGSLAAKLAGVPVIINTITGLGYVFEKGGVLEHVVRGLYKLAFSGRTQVVFQNRDDEQLFISRKVLKRENSTVILGSGVNCEIIHPKNNGIEHDGLRFLLVSRMLWSKGIKEFVCAAKKIKKQYPKTNFVMAGGASGGGAKGNPEAIPEEWLNSVNKEGVVKWVGRVPFTDILALLDNSDVVVLPSYYPEGVPKSLIEASAKGKPIITTDTPGCREVVVDRVNGFLVQPKNEKALAHAMQKMIHDPKLSAQMGIASRKRAVDLFDEKKILEQTITVYRKAGITFA